MPNDIKFCSKCKRIRVYLRTMCANCLDKQRKRLQLARIGSQRKVRLPEDICIDCLHKSSKHNIICQ